MAVLGPVFSFWLVSTAILWPLTDGVACLMIHRISSDSNFCLLNYHYSNYRHTANIIFKQKYEKWIKENTISLKKKKKCRTFFQLHQENLQITWIKNSKKIISRILIVECLYILYRKFFWRSRHYIVWGQAANKCAISVQH